MEFRHTVTYENIEFTVTNYQRRARLSITLFMQRTNFMVISGITCLSACYRLDAGTIFRRTNRIEIAETPIMTHVWHRLFIIMFYLVRNKSIKSRSRPWA